MLSDAELQQMLADAERIEALRGKATPGPWEVCHDGWQIRGPEPETGLDKGPKVAHTCVGMTGNIEQQVDDAEFIAATRTDPSAANVRKLVEEVRRLRNKLRLFIDHPNGDPLYYDPSVIAESVVQSRRDAEANEVITACHIHNVPVPEHLKAYEEEVE